MITPLQLYTKVLIALVIVFGMPVSGQQYFFDNYSVSDGLAQSKVYDILQDNGHFIWLGTQVGVSRFDGKVFENINEKDGISPNGVRCLFMDSKGRIWMGHNGGGISLYNGKTFATIQNQALAINGDVTSIIEDKDGRIWITTINSGAFQLTENIENTGYSIKQFKGKSLSDWVFGTSMLRDSTLLFITDVGLKTFIPDSGFFKPYTLKGLSHFFQFIDIYEDSQQNIWFGTYHGGLYKYNQPSKTFTYFTKDNGLADDWISCIQEDKSGNLWVGTWGGGISMFSPDGAILNFNTSNGLQDNKINHITEDVEGNLLIGTFEHGLSLFKGFQFINYSTSDNLVSDQIKSMTQSTDGRMWFGTNGGLTQYNGNRFKSYSRPGYNISNDINVITFDSHKRLWIGTDEGVFSLDTRAEKFEYDPIININLLPSSKKVNDLVIDKSNHVWIATNDGLVEYDINSRMGKRHSQINGLCGNEIRALYIDPNQNMWIGVMNKGVTLYTKGPETFQCIESLSGFTPTAFTMDPLNRLWIATEGNDLLIYQHDTIVRMLDETDGLLTTSVQSLNADANNVYIGTIRGLNIYKLKEEKIYTYTKRNGFTGIETKPRASYIDQHGNVWFGTLAGAMKYNPEKEVGPIMEPLTHIKSILVNKKPRTFEHGIKLRHYENEITFNFYSICLADPNSVQYQYKLEPMEKEWHEPTEVNFKEYNTLKPGKYTFMLRAKNNFGNWNSDSSTNIFYIIKKPFYATVWFISLCFFIVVAGIFSYIKIREQNLIMEKKILEETVAERTAELKEKKDELELINKDITDSIHYAQRIQFAMLPPGPPFDDTFVFFRPKDIVSGDFYWFQQQGTMEFLSAVDCTGHGVPGAFMSFIGYNTLTKIVKEYGIFDPAEILGKLNEEVINTLRQSHKNDDYSNVQDGMDLALVSYDTVTKKLDFAGAYNPLIHIQNGELTEYKADRVAIGYDLKTVYTTHTIAINEGDSIYMFSDGFADQFGSDNRKKYKVAQLKRLLLSFQDKPMEVQKEMLAKELDSWMGQTEQIDDILIMGRKF